jgi:hypothetical protein
MNRKKCQRSPKAISSPLEEINTVCEEEMERKPKAIRGPNT